jgi:hypothetical protein
MMAGDPTPPGVDASATGVAPSPMIPRYGTGSLADLLPSLLSALGLEGFPNPLQVEPIAGLCLLVVDGLGYELIRNHRAEAPFLAAAAESRPALTAGFPATTSASLGSLGTGLPPGEHGLVGYTFLLPGLERPMNALLWELYGVGPRVDLSDQVVPERFQPHATLLERSEAAGLPVTVVGPPEHAASPLTRCILRGGMYEGAVTLDDLVLVTSSRLSKGGRGAVYAYHPFLDTTAHLKGVGSDEWLAYLHQVDRAVEAVAGRLPPSWALVVTGDHGMVNLTEGQKIDVDDRPDLAAGVRVLGGEARARHVYTEPGATQDVFAAWQELLGDGMWIVTRDQAVAAGWFGPRVSEAVRPRIGDVVAASFGAVGIVQRAVDPLQVMLVGHHGSMTEAEQLVPFALIR